MGYERRGIDGGYASGSSTPANANLNQLSENDTHITEYVYNDVSGSLSIGQPLYVDMRDAAELNNKYPGVTALTTPTGATGGNVVLGTTSAGTGPNLVCVGVFYSADLNEKPNKGDVIRVCDRGRALIQATSKAAGTAVLVGDVLIADTTPGVNVISGHNTRNTGTTIGYALATLAALTVGASIIAVPGSGSTTQLINGYVQLT